MTTIALLPAPADIGLPEKFDQWRKGQAEAVLRVMDTDKRFIVLGMPTGFGKSLAYMAAGVLGDPTVFLTSTKGLQSQLVEDFSESGLVDIRGMGNYPCREANDGIFTVRDKPVLASCDEGPCLAGWKCPYAEDGCHYFDSRRLAATSPLTVTNYSYWMSINGGERKDDRAAFPLGQRGRLVLDEAHAAVDELGGYLAIEVGYWEIEGVLGRGWPSTSVMEEWRTWAGTLAQECVRKVEQLSSEIRMGVANNRKGLSRFRELKDLGRRLFAIAGMKGEWVNEESRDRRGRRVVRFDPVWPGSYSETALFLNIPKVVLTSATIRPKTLDLLGVKPNEYEFIEYPSSFPVSNRTVVWVPTVRVRYDMDPGHTRQWVAKIDAIIRNRLDRKGVIHTVSYSRRDYIFKYSEFANRMLSHDAGGLQDCVRRFRESGPGTLLVSPSAGTGFDFPGDDCRYQIIGKVPFPDSRSKVLQARQERDKDFFAYVAAQSIVQMAGRGVRSVDDWCETFIIDDNWQWFINKYKGFMPRWFTAACRKSTMVPEPAKLARAIPLTRRQSL